ncbi:MAG: hypothetical protein Q7J44_17360 [Pseudotabrizicola sp.]|uniref:hypothetical protein n=1 Tax=Pseudotabrizicola sp. TaxID=2939647 RepID=UPI00272134EB|nr:hypothetical protein [Pseudotabrizicola sp.]MDO9640307.1 hypothetical protein [Pseudotabrizicola sp.]
MTPPSCNQSLETTEILSSLMGLNFGAEGDQTSMLVHIRHVAGVQAMHQKAFNVAFFRVAWGARLHPLSQVM